MFRQRSCWLLNMIDRRVCVCRISPVHHQPPVARQTLCLPVAHQRVLSQQESSMLHWGSLQTLTAPAALLPAFPYPYSPSPRRRIEVSARSCGEKGSMIGTFIEWEEICEALGNKHHQLLSADKQLVREGIGNQIEGESLSGCRDNSGEDLVNGACVSGFAEMECRDINFHLE